MKKEIITKRLHHRPPYLLINEVIEHRTDFLKAGFTAEAEHFFIQGHFPEMPIVPGSMMQEMTTQAGGLLISEHHSPVPDYDSQKTKGFALGVLRSVQFAKYRTFARPGDRLIISVTLIEHLESYFRFKGSIEVAGKKIMSNEFTLINISDEKLFFNPC